MGDLYRGFDQEELDAQYRAAATVPNMQEFIDDYVSLSAVARETLDHVADIQYGRGGEESLDLFPVPDKTDAPLFVFIHGGYWRMLSKNESSFMAPNLVSQGVAVAAINYTLVPDADIDQIVAECRRSIAWLYNNASAHGIDPNRIYVGGSSAGGHLTGMMVAGGWQETLGLPPDVVKGGLPISGLLDMEPITQCFVNEWMKMTPEDGLRNSPDRNLPDTGSWGCPLIVAAGGNETDEFRRQSEDFAALWQSNGWQAEYLECSGLNHFNVPMELCKPDSPMTQKLLAMIAQ
ncbi:MAG: alpha/beta hydrolase [Rhodospirillales bacterium]